MSNFGHFSEDGSEYIFTTPVTPRPMLNYLWNDRFLSGVNQLGGGDGAYGNRAATYIDPEGKGRAVLFKDGMRYFYIRDDMTGEFWNPAWYPVKKEYDFYRCRHGLGYSILESRTHNIHSSFRVFVGEQEPCEIWTVKITNESQSERTLKIYPFIEYTLTGYKIYSNYYSNVFSQFNKEKNLMVAFNTTQDRTHEWFNGFVASSLDITGFESSKKQFIGPYGQITAPETVSTGTCKNSLAACEDMVGVVENTLFLKPGQTIIYHVLFGAADSMEEAVRITEKLFKKERIEEEFETLKVSKKRMAEETVINTPDLKVNNLINKWIKQQVKLCAEVGRDTGKGFRDQLQDAWAISSFDPRLAREKILETLGYEYSDGRCVRGWLPLDNHIYSDGPTWIAPTVNAYIKETGDFDFLQETVPYLDEGESTVWEHILTAVRYSSGDTGERELVLAHDGDWNDSLNGIGTGGKGESVWTSIALYFALCNVAEMADKIFGDSELAAEMAERAEKIKQAVNRNGWDGRWYLAGYTDEGKKVGSHTEKEGSIYLNSQTWAVMARVAEGARAEQCLKAVDEKLDSPYGPLTLYPAYTSYKPEIGRLTGFIPGIWENGTPYCHGGTFKIVADCYAGRGNKAYETVLKIMPDSETNPSGRSGCEPYALTNMYFGPDNPKSGQTMFAWVTGTAGWMYRAVTQYMLGFYPGYDDITIKPCIPDSWEKCTIKRVYRKDVYVITINNVHKAQNTVKSISVDGRVIKGSRFKIFGDRKEHHILVEMG